MDKYHSSISRKEMPTSSIATIDEPESFDEEKSCSKLETNETMEPVFSTASGVRINVTAESLEKTKNLFQQEKSNNIQKNFSSPLARASNSSGKQFISPFQSTNNSNSVRGSIQSPASLKRPRSDFVSPLLKNNSEDVAPPVKKTFISNIEKFQKKELDSENLIEMTENVQSQYLKSLCGQIVKIEEFLEESELRLIIVVEPKMKKLLVRLSRKDYGNIKLFDHIQLINIEFDKEVCDPSVNEIFALNEAVQIKKIKSIQNETQKEHSFAIKPFIRQPIFIHQLKPSTTFSTQVAVIKANIVDFGPKFYNGCSNCKYRFSSKTEQICPKCEKRSPNEKCIYSLMRVVDFSGQLKVHVPHEVMINFLKMLGYENVKQMDRFSNLEEQMSFIFKPVMIKIEKSPHNKEMWTVLEFGDVDWVGYTESLKRKQLPSKINSSGEML